MLKMPSKNSKSHKTFNIKILCKQPQKPFRKQTVKLLRTPMKTLKVGRSQGKKEVAFSIVMAIG